MVGGHSRGRRIVAGVVVLLAALVFGASSAFAEPNPKASCMGLEAEGISPPGTGPGGEFGGGMPDVRRFIQEVFGIHNPGAAISAFAQLHLETHEACDEAVGLG